MLGTYPKKRTWCSTIRHLITHIAHINLLRYTIGIDVGSTDLTVFTLTGFTLGYKHAIAIDKAEINHAGVDEIWRAFKQWFDPYFNILGTRVYGAFIDSAAQILKSSLAPLLMREYNMNIADSYKYTIKERVDWGIRFIHQGRVLFTERTRETYDSLTIRYMPKTYTQQTLEYFQNICIKTE